MLQQYPCLLLCGALHGNGPSKIWKWNISLAETSSMYLRHTRWLLKSAYCFRSIRCEDNVIIIVIILSQSHNNKHTVITSHHKFRYGDSQRRGYLNKQRRRFLLVSWNIYVVKENENWRRQIRRYRKCPKWFTLTLSIIVILQ